MTVEQYLAQGGTITKLPTGTALHGHSPHQPERTLPPTALLGMSYTEAMRQFFDEAKAAQREKAFKKSNQAGLKKAKQTQGERARIRRARLVAEYKRGDSMETMAQREGCSVDRIRDILRQEGAR